MTELERAWQVLGQLRLSSGPSTESVIAKAIEEAVAAEREACAKLADSVDVAGVSASARITARRLAERIRGRGAK